MFKRTKLEKILKQIKKDRNNYFSGELYNIVFLDFDGVLNLDINDYSCTFPNKELINNLNNFCIKNNFKIVVISSWRKSIDYKEKLYRAGLYKQIEILGATKSLEKDRESEVIKYLDEHHNINKFIIIDDGDFLDLNKYQVKTDFKKGFNNEKYQEACKLIREIE